MSDNSNVVLVAAVAVGVVLLMKQSAAKAAPAAGNVPVTNVNGQLWRTLLGGGWNMLTDAKNSDGTAAFLKKDFLGNIFTTDGKPVGQELMDLFPTTYGLPSVVDTAASDGIDYLSQLGW